ncbi:MAG TPA: hypothetical protein VGG99_18115 [Acetobacteraceae bacterium]|jgi:hypothetical protein
MDPAHGGRADRKSARERTIGLALEVLGEVPALIHRDPAGQADFIDGAGQKWDVKGFNSAYPPIGGGFDLQRDADKVDKSLTAGEHVMLDTGKLSPNDLQDLRDEGLRRGWGQRVKWWP